MDPQLLRLLQEIDGDLFSVDVPPAAVARAAAAAAADTRPHREAHPLPSFRVATAAGAAIAQPGADGSAWDLLGPGASSLLDENVGVTSERVASRPVVTHSSTVAANRGSMLAATAAAAAAAAARQHAPGAVTAAPSAADWRRSGELVMQSAAAAVATHRSVLLAAPALLSSVLAPAALASPATAAAATAAAAAVSSAAALDAPASPSSAPDAVAAAAAAAAEGALQAPLPTLRQGPVSLISRLARGPRGPYKKKGVDMTEAQEMEEVRAAGDDVMRCLPDWRVVTCFPSWFCLAFLCDGVSGNSTQFCVKAFS